MGEHPSSLRPRCSSVPLCRRPKADAQSRYSELTSPGYVEQILLLFVLLDVGGEERADRDHLQFALARSFKTGADQCFADALSPMLGRHLGVSEHDHALGQRVLGDGDRIAKLDFEAATLEIIRSEEHTSELQSLMRISYAVFCLK